MLPGGYSGGAGVLADSGTLPCQGSPWPPPPWDLCGSAHKGTDLSWSQYHLILLEAFITHPRGLVSKAAVGQTEVTWGGPARQGAQHSGALPRAWSAAVRVGGTRGLGQGGAVWLRPRPGWWGVGSARVSLPDCGAGTQKGQTCWGGGKRTPLVPCHHSLDPHCTQRPMSRPQ